MGYCYGIGPSGREVLACDICGAAQGDSRKVPCPFGWCPATAACGKCRADPAVRAKYLARKVHRDQGCEESSLADKAKRAETTRRLLAGEELRSSATALDEGLTQVVFANAFQGRYVWVLMAPETYRAFRYDVDCTVEDFARHGRVVRGPVGYARTPEEIKACWTAWNDGGVPEGTNIETRQPEPRPEPEPERRLVKVAAGQTFRLAKPLTFRTGEQLDTFTLLAVPGRRNLAEHAGRRYRLPRGWKTQVVGILPP